MQTVQLYDYFSFGFNYYILLHDSASDKISDFSESLKKYVQFVEGLDLIVTKSCLNLQNFEEDLTKLNKLNKGAKKNAVVPPELHKSIISKIKKADSTLDAELDTKNAFLLRQKRVSNDILINDVGKLFSKYVYYQLPEIARFDFKECGQCIAYERFTAAAFHALRGTEDVLKYYYSNLLSVVPKESQTWGNFHFEIDKEVKSGTISPAPSEELMINLDHLRKHYRNKTQHPQLIYTADDVQDLFFSCIKVVNQMFNDLKSRKMLDELLF